MLYTVIYKRITEIAEEQYGAVGAAVAQDPYTVTVTGSNPVLPTINGEIQGSVDSIDTAKNNVELTKRKYVQLTQDQDFLRCLEVCGVDNWSGYEYAVAMFQKENPDAEEAYADG